uniref:Uncharacterized protein n=1 Tax=Trypanosoma vivax (strain Y486) TaxID=1055687 RepID=G0UB55_TRYVY|nr:hypothetical protein TVY486_1105260 [Trypanosoma vivax Y486]
MKGRKSMTKTLLTLHCVVISPSKHILFFNVPDTCCSLLFILILLPVTQRMRLHTSLLLLLFVRGEVGWGWGNYQSLFLSAQGAAVDLLDTGLGHPAPGL